MAIPERWNDMLEFQQHRIVLIGGEKLIAENWGELSAYTDKYIMMETKDKKMILCGEGLVLREISKDYVEINGNITAFELEAK